MQSQNFNNINGIIFVNRANIGDYRYLVYNDNIATLYNYFFSGGAVLKVTFTV